MLSYRGEEKFPFNFKSRIALPGALQSFAVPPFEVHHTAPGA